MKHFISNSSIIHYRLSFLLLTLGLYLLFFSPLLGSLNTHTTSPNDGPLIIWLIHQSAEFWQGSGSLYHWPMFHPYPYTATYSDPFLTLGLVLLVIKLFTDNVIAQNNILILCSSFATFVSMYLLAKSIWRTTLTAWLTAVVFCFSFLYLQFAVHLHTFFIAGVPLSLWAIIKYLETRHFKFLIFFGASFLMQAFNAPMTAYFIGAVVLVYLVFEKKLILLLKDRYFLATIFLVIAVCVWLYTPYFITAEKYDAARTIRDTAHFSFSVSRLLWVDIVFPLGILLLSFFLKKRTDTTQPISIRTCLAIAAVGAVCMLGPVAKFQDQTIKIFSLPIPLPYAVVYYVVPGISAFRAVTRWSIVLNLGLSLGIGWLIHTSKIKLRIIVVLLAIWLISMGLLFQQEVELFLIPSQPPSIYSTVKSENAEVLAEFPMTQWDMTPFDGLEHKRLLYQLHHDKKLYNGVSGFMPPARSVEIHHHFENFPNDQSLDILRDNGVDMVIIHFDEYQSMEDDKFRYGEVNSMPLSELIESVNNQPRLELIECTNAPVDCAYRLK